mgnify:CR=1 FL=1
MQLFMITADKTVEILSRIFVIPAAQVCTGRNVFQPKYGGENLFADAARIEGQGAFDTLFFNSDGLLLEGGRSNVFIKYQGQWLTPSLDLDILNGVMRQAVLKQPWLLGADTIKETHISRTMLENAEEIRLSNALRGVFAVSLRK